VNGQPNLSRGIQHRYLLVKESRFVREIAEKNMSFHKKLPQHRIFTQILEFSSFKHTNDQTELDNRHLHIILQFYRFLKPIQQNINEKSSSLRYERLQIHIWKGPRNNILTSNKLLVFQDHHPLPFLEEALMSFQISH